MRRFVFVLLLSATVASPLSARDSLGVFGQWGAFRDAEVPRCYAIAASLPRRNGEAGSGFASIGTWPQRQVRGQLHLRLSRAARSGSAISLRIGGSSFALAGSENDAWAADRQMDARIAAQIRSAGSMQVSARDAQGRLFTDSYSLDGAATAMDAASVGCAGS